MKKIWACLLACALSFCGGLHASETPVDCKVSIVGGGIVGALESYYAYREAQEKGQKICVSVYERGDSFEVTAGQSSTNTAYNIVPSLTIDEILSVVPRGSQLVEKLGVLFSQPGGIRVDDVAGANDSDSAIRFKKAVEIYGSDINHDDRTLALLTLGKKSMDLWQQIYDEADQELKGILEASNFNPCREPRGGADRHLHDGYRIDLIYGIPNAEMRALGMKGDYEKLGYTNCAILSPDEVAVIDPYLADFCKSRSSMDADGKRVWNKDCVALWRPGGCIDTRVFLPKFYAYMKKAMEQTGDCFQLQFGKEVVAVTFDPASDNLRVHGLRFSDGSEEAGDQFVFCPGESVGTLQRLGFQEPAYAGFAGASLLLSIPLSDAQTASYKNFSHCMEVHNEGIVLAWQARFKEDQIFIGVAGTKSFYGDKQPNKTEAFSKDRNLVQLNMVNHVLPEFISMACGYDTKGKTLTADDLASLEARNIANRWVGRRAVAYDGFPTIGALYVDNQKVSNARCTTHLGSGGVSFGPGAVFMSRSAIDSTDPLVQKILKYADSRRTAMLDGINVH